LGVESLNGCDKCQIYASKEPFSLGLEAYFLFIRLKSSLMTQKGLALFAEAVRMQEKSLHGGVSCDKS
jgi:hypothetical protein